MKKAKQSTVTIIGCFALLFALFYWVWLFYITQPATPKNTLSYRETIIAVEPSLASHRGSDKLYLSTQTHTYTLVVGWRNKNMTYELAQKILAASQDCYVTVWKHIPKYLLDVTKDGFQVYQVVDLRDDSIVYWDIDSHNNYQRTECVAGIIGGAFLTPIVIIFIFLCFLGSRKRF